MGRPTAAYFVLKGFRVLSCRWQNTGVAIEQEHLIRSLTDHASTEMKPLYLGMLQTVWGPVPGFMKGFQAKTGSGKRDASADCFRKLTEVW